MITLWEKAWNAFVLSVGRNVKKNSKSPCYNKKIMVTLYSTKICPWCKTVEKYLQMKKVQYQKIYVDDDHQKRQELFEMTGMTSVPVTTNGKEFVVGWNAGKINNLISLV